MIVQLHIEQGLFDELEIISYLEAESIHDLIIKSVNEHLNRKERKLTKRPEEFKRRVAGFIAKRHLVETRRKV